MAPLILAQRRRAACGEFERSLSWCSARHTRWTAQVPYANPSMGIDPGFLAQISLFAQLDDDERSVLAQVMAEQAAHRARCCSAPASPGDSMFIVRAARSSCSSRTRPARRSCCTPRRPAISSASCRCSMAARAPRPRDVVEATTLLRARSRGPPAAVPQAPRCGARHARRDGRHDAQGERAAPGARREERQRGGRGAIAAASCCASPTGSRTSPAASRSS